MSAQAITDIGTYDPEAGKYVSKETSEDLQADFMLLLTKQLQYQDPMAPMENQDFTAQLATFSSLDQQTESNDLLEQILAAQGSSDLDRGVNYIGKNVVIEGNGLTVTEGAGLGFFELDEPADITVNVINKHGEVVFQKEMPRTQAGEHAIDLSEEGLPDGEYQISVVGENYEGSRVVGTPLRIGQVTGVVQKEDGTTMLDVGGIETTVAKIRRIAL